jgi:hypothetical protein
MGIIAEARRLVIAPSPWLDPHRRSPISWRAG